MEIVLSKAYEAKIEMLRNKIKQDEKCRFMSSEVTTLIELAKKETIKEIKDAIKQELENAPTSLMNDKFYFSTIINHVLKIR